MNVLNKKIQQSLVIIAVAVFFSAQVSIVCSAESAASNEALAFLEDVVKIDVKAYDIEVLGSLVSQPDWLGGLSQTTGKINLESKTSKLSVLYTVVDNSLSWCQVTATEGAPSYSEELPQKANEITDGFLQRYQTYTGEAKVEEMRQMLQTVDVSKNTTKTVNNITLGVSVDELSSSFSWTNTYNDADYSGMCVVFNDGEFHSLKDDTSYYKIGGTEVNINAQEAKEIALKTVEGFYWSIGGENVTDFKVVEDLISAQLLTRSRTPLELYPYWLVDLPLDEIYPGNVYTITVLIWADNSEVLDCYTQTFGGSIPEFPAWTTISVLIIVLAVFTMVYKRKLNDTPIQHRNE